MSDIGPAPQGVYVAATIHNGVVDTAGMTPRIDGVLQSTGTVGSDLTVEQGFDAAALCARNALAAATSVAGQLDRCLQMTVYVACSDDFIELSAVADGASSAIVEALGHHALPARTAIGVKNLPSGAPVEVALTAVARVQT